MLLRLAISAALLASASARGGIRGWNSYDDADGSTNRSATLAAAQYMHDVLLPHGYDLVTIDGGWSDHIDGFGRQLPSAKLSDDGSLASLAAEVHALGLRFGVWTIRGIPKAAVAQRLPIWNSTFTADQAARGDKNCSWDADNMGVLANDAGRAYYASVAALYKGFGVDFVKIDCMVENDEGLLIDDFTAFAEAMKAQGILVSISPGHAQNIVNATYVAERALATHYRISDDLWDIWDDKCDGNCYPSGVKGKFSRIANFAPLIGQQDAFADLDMLPLGVVYHMVAGGAGGQIGPPSPTHLTRDEQTTLMTLAIISRAPLIFGGRLPLDADDAWTLSLLTNDEALQAHGLSGLNRPVPAAGGGEAHAWAAAPEALPQPSAFVALFNAGDTDADISVELRDAGLDGSGLFCVRDLWAKADNGSATGALTRRLAAHGAGLYLLAACAGGAETSAPGAAAGDISVVRSSADGEQWAPQPALSWGADFASARVVGVSTGTRKQEVLGFGACMTDTSAYNTIVWMNETVRAQLVEAYWGASGLGYTVSRMHINSPDYAFMSYNLDNVTDDFALTHFDTALTYDHEHVIPLLKLASAAASEPIKFFGSPWSPPAWMKKPCACCHDMICSAEAPCLRDDVPGGSYYAAWALYFVKWLDAMEAAGVHMWGLTPQNEPEAIQQNFESCAWRPQDQADFVVQHLGPALASAGYGNHTLMGYDHNKRDALVWAQALLGNATVRSFVNAFAVHWYDYGATLALDNVAAIRTLLGPDAVLLNTEACYLEQLVYDWRVGELYAADVSLRARAPTNAPARTLSLSCCVLPSPHCSQIIGDLNFGVNGWLQWNVVLLTGDKYPEYLGGPNHDFTRSFGDPVLFEFNASGTQRLIMLPSYWVIGQISRFARPGSRLVPSGGAGTAASAADYDDVRAYSLSQKDSTDFLLSVAFVSPDGATASVVVANPTNDVADFKLLDSDAPGGARAARASLPAHSIATFSWAL